MLNTVLIDGANLYATTRALNWQIDFALLTAWLREEFGPVRVNYYTAVLEDEQGHRPLQQLIDWLSYNGYNLVTKEARVYTSDNGPRRVKGNMDIEIAIDAFNAATNQTGDTIVLFSGDGDFVPLIRELQRRGKWVIVVSSNRITPAICSDELRRAADNFIDLALLRGALCKETRERNE